MSSNFLYVFNYTGTAFLGLYQYVLVASSSPFDSGKDTKLSLSLGAIALVHMHVCNRELEKRMVALRLWTGRAIFGGKVEIGDAFLAFFLPANTLPLDNELVQSARSAFESLRIAPPAVRLQKDLRGGRAFPKSEFNKK